MEKARPLLRPLAQSLSRRTLTPAPRQPWICQQCLRTSRRTTPSTRPHRPLQPFLLRPQRRHQSQQPADDPAFSSIVDNPPTLIRSNRKHNRWGLALLAAIPITAFVLGCWQVQRLSWKTDLIARFEDRLVRDPLPLPPQIDPDAIKDFDYRRVYARGRFRHEREMLIGPRLHDGEDGYLVITPLEREGKGSTVLVCRGWIPKDKAAQSSRHPSALPQGEVVVEGLLREPWKKNSFTPENRPDEGKWYFPDVHQMAEYTGSQAVWVEETMKPDLLVTYDRTAKGVPIGRAPEVNLRNNHTQYIFTWFSLSLATSIMLWMVVKRPPGGGRGRIRRNTGW
ncbi:SURF1-domain-containing protein [Teratosphaeria nubilosa]|uniref:SURF1-like protein n=1 Tax=Teratosphaeria nubilosa TaxID=161662 RepID=A0A6G1LP13_9PEZI|nr:SURF1-domain-containing protein [Teratosphaeria nubilosa]